MILGCCEQDLQGTGSFDHVPIAMRVLFMLTTLDNFDPVVVSVNASLLRNASQLGGHSVNNFLCCRGLHSARIAENPSLAIHT